MWRNNKPLKWRGHLYKVWCSGTNLVYLEYPICSPLCKTLLPPPSVSCSVQKNRRKTSSLVSYSHCWHFCYPSLASGLCMRQARNYLKILSFRQPLLLALVWKELVKSKRGCIWNLEGSWEGRDIVSWEGCVTEDTCFLVWKPYFGNLNTLIVFFSSFFLPESFLKQLIHFCEMAVTFGYATEKQKSCVADSACPHAPNVHSSFLPVWQNSDFLWGRSETRQEKQSKK